MTVFKPAIPKQPPYLCLLKQLSTTWTKSLPNFDQTHNLFANLIAQHGLRQEETPDSAGACPALQLRPPHGPPLPVCQSHLDQGRRALFLALLQDPLLQED